MCNELNLAHRELMIYYINHLYHTAIDLGLHCSEESSSTLMQTHRAPGAALLTRSTVQLQHDDSVSSCYL
jgi:hypothetical protein